MTAARVGARTYLTGEDRDRAREQARQMLADGKSVKHIAREIGLSLRPAYSLAAEAGKPRSQLRGEERARAAAQVRARKAAGETYRSIAKDLGKGYTTVRELAKEGPR